MDSSPIKSGTISIKKCDLLKNRQLVGIDRGSSLTKVIFLSKDDKTQLSDNETEWLTLNYALFRSADLEHAIKWTRDRAYFQEGTEHPVHVTGHLESCRKDVVESILGLKVEHVDKMLAIVAGHVIALQEIGLKQLMSAPVVVKYYREIKSEFLDKITEALACKMSVESSSSTLPCLIQVCGSLTEFYFIDKDGRAQLMSWQMTGGTSFLGLAKCLLDTNIYDEVIRLASTGNRANIETQIKDIISDNIDSPYGLHLGDLPVFPFGKCVDSNKGLEGYAKEDVAISLVAFFCNLIITNCVRVCQVKGVPKVYLSGSIFHSDLFQTAINTWLAFFPTRLELEILNFEHFGALGAMLCDNSDKEKYYKNL